MSESDVRTPEKRATPRASKSSFYRDTSRRWAARSASISLQFQRGACLSSTLDLPIYSSSLMVHIGALDLGYFPSRHLLSQWRAVWLSHLKRTASSRFDGFLFSGNKSMKAKRPFRESLRQHIYGQVIASVKCGAPEPFPLPILHILPPPSSGFCRIGS